MSNRFGDLIAEARQSSVVLAVTAIHSRNRENGPYHVVAPSRNVIPDGDASIFDSTSVESEDVETWVGAVLTFLTNGNEPTADLAPPESTEPAEPPT